MAVKFLGQLKHCDIATSTHISNDGINGGDQIGIGHRLKSKQISQFILNNDEIVNLPVTLSIGMIGLYSCMAISYNLGNHYKLYIPGCITLSTFAFLFMVATFGEEGNLQIASLGAKGLFTSMVCALLTVELYHFCKEKTRIKYGFF